MLPEVPKAMLRPFLSFTEIPVWSIVVSVLLRRVTARLSYRKEETHETGDEVHSGRLYTRKR